MVFNQHVCLPFLHSMPGLHVVSVLKLLDSFFNVRYFKEKDFEGPSPVSASGKEATVIGWGYTEYDPFKENKLQSAGEDKVASRILQKLVVSLHNVSYQVFLYKDKLIQLC